MNIRMDNLLPVADIDITYLDYTTTLKNVLIDTGCAVTVFDTDCASKAGLFINSTISKINKMVGLGNGVEYCCEQWVSELIIEGYTIYDFHFQLTDLSPYGFDAILGADFFNATGCVLDFSKIS